MKTVSIFSLCFFSLISLFHTLNAMHQFAKTCNTSVSKTYMLSQRFNRFVIQPTIKQVLHFNQRAPQKIQILSHDYAQAMLENDKKFLSYLEKFGFCTVYHGSDKRMPDFFKETGSQAHTNMYGGIHFPKNSFPYNSLTALQRFILAHEVGHHALGHTALFPIVGCQAGSSEWFEHEYQAQALCTSLLYKKFKDYDALEANLHDEFMMLKNSTARDKALYTAGPLCTGMHDTLALLNTQHPHDTKLRVLCSDAHALVTNNKYCDQSKRYGQFLALHIRTLQTQRV